MDMPFQMSGVDMDYGSPAYSTASSPFDASAVKDIDMPAFSLYPPLDPPSREDWERFKTTILEQYVGMNLTVKELVNYMEMWFQFKATCVPFSPPPRLI
jgi:hypothetical protein